MSHERTYDEIFDQASIDKVVQEMGTCNVLIAGGTGVGKSTLINSVFHGRMAATGDGRPITKNARLIRKEGVPLCVWDTRGLEMADFRETLDELAQLVERRARDPDPERHIHVAWLCILEDGRRVQKAESSLCRALSERMPVLGVITKARSDEGDGFRAEVQRLLPEARNVVPVRAIAEVVGGHKLEPMGLDDLIKATIGLLPEGIRQAFAAAQRVSLRQKRERAHRCVWSSSAAAATAAAIPFADAAALVPIQIRMLAEISAVYGLDVTRAFLTRLLFPMLGPAFAAMGGRAIAAGLLKLIPGGGMVLGGVISAAVASSLTFTLGETYIVALDKAFAKSKSDMPNPAAIEADFKKRIRKGIRKARRDTRRAALRRGIGGVWPFRERNRSTRDGRGQPS